LGTQVPETVLPEFTYTVDQDGAVKVPKALVEVLSVIDPFEEVTLTGEVDEPIVLFVKVIFVFAEMEPRMTVLLAVIVQHPEVTAPPTLPPVMLTVPLLEVTEPPITVPLVVIEQHALNTEPVMLPLVKLIVLLLAVIEPNTLELPVVVIVLLLLIKFMVLVAEPITLLFSAIPAFAVILPDAEMETVSPLANEILPLQVKFAPETLQVPPLQTGHVLPLPQLAPLTKEKLAAFAVKGKRISRLSKKNNFLS